MNRIDLKYALIVFVILILWSSSFIGIRYALYSYSPENLGFLRYLTASIIFLVASLFQKIRFPAISDWPGVIALGLFGFALYNLLINYGEITVDAGSSSFIINTVPLFTLLFAIILKTEAPTKNDWTGMGVAFSGVALIILSKNKGIHTFNWGMLLILGAAICQALYFIWQKKYLKKYTPFELTCYAVWIGTLLMAFFARKPFLNLGSAPISRTLTVVYLGVFPGALAFLLIGIVLKKYSLSTFSSYLFMIPFITVFISWIFLNEFLPMMGLIGGSLVILGILVKNNYAGPGKSPATMKMNDRSQD